MQFFGGIFLEASSYGVAVDRIIFFFFRFWGSGGVRVLRRLSVHFT